MWSDMQRLALFVVVVVASACHVIGVVPLPCDGDVNCPDGDVCDGNVCVDAGEGEEAEGEEGEGEEGEGEEGEGEDCVIGGPCEPEVLASGLKEPRGIAVADGRIFVTAGGVIAAGCVKEVRAGAELRDVFCEDGGSGVRPVQVAVTSTHLYWINDDDVAHATVRRADLDGVGAAVVAVIGWSSSAPRSRSILASNGDTASWVDEGASPSLFTDVVGGTAITHDGDSLPKALSMTDTRVVFGGNTNGVFAVSIDAAPSTTPTTLVASKGSLLASAVIDGGLRIFSFSSGTVAIGAGAAVERFEVAADDDSGDPAEFVAVDREHVWWLTSGERCRLWRSNADTDAVVELVNDDIVVCAGLAVDDNFVYVVDLDSGVIARGQVLRFRKPR